MIDPTPAFFDTLMRTQFLQPDRMQAYQRGLLERLVRHARTQVPFYRDQGRLDPLFTPNDEIDWSRWTEIPVLTRAEAQRNEQALYARERSSCLRRGHLGLHRRLDRNAAGLSRQFSARRRQRHSGTRLRMGRLARRGVAGKPAQRQKRRMPLSGRPDLSIDHSRRDAGVIALPGGADAGPGPGPMARTHQARRGHELSGRARFGRRTSAGRIARTPLQACRLHR